MKTIVKNQLTNSERTELINLHTSDGDGPALYVGTYGKYNSGSLAGAWVDLQSFANAEDFFDFCANVLHSDEHDPELMMQDFQGFPRALYSECPDHETIDKIIEFAELDDDDREMVKEYWDNISDDADIREIKDNCVYHGNFEDFACMEADEYLHCNNCPDFISRYFDYDAFARDLKYDYDVTDNFVFCTR